MKGLDEGTSGVGAVTMGEVATCAVPSTARAGLETGVPGRRAF